MNGTLRMIFRLAHLVHSIGKLAARRHTGKHYVTRVGKKRLPELVAFPRIARNMEFHHKKASLPNSYNRQKANATTGAGPRFPPLDSSRLAAIRPRRNVTPATRKSGTSDFALRLSAPVFPFSRRFDGRLYFEQSPPNRYSRFIAFRFDAQLLGWGWQARILPQPASRLGRPQNAPGNG
jgi:hypothetical protein